MKCRWLDTCAGLSMACMLWLLCGDTDICASSIGSYFSRTGYTCTAGVYRIRPPMLCTTSVPHIQHDVSNTESRLIQNIYEWLGFVACRWYVDCNFWPLIRDYAFFLTRMINALVFVFVHCRPLCSLFNETLVRRLQTVLAAYVQM